MNEEIQRIVEVIAELSHPEGPHASGMQECNNNVIEAELRSFAVALVQLMRPSIDTGTTYLGMNPFLKALDEYILAKSLELGINPMFFSPEALEPAEPLQFRSNKLDKYIEKPYQIDVDTGK